jgi:hypothetical protein
VLNRLNLLDEIDAAMFFAAWCQGTVPAGQRADLDATIDRVVGRFCGSAWMGDEDDLTGEAWAFVLDEMLAKWRPYVSGEGIGDPCTFPRAPRSTCTRSSAPDAWTSTAWR